ncbi:PRD domain-containing protein [Staphylococcus cohnii]|uniref:PRD domain-containing protein n=1 Tax=Staphylococcus cohnii TaxID=29382 RepID=A0ABT6J2E3_9STAP|nr:PRD domain-containing protein [Staphylococcus cohnii]MDH5140822.1 PRD domain-containing protein [Staphylococcus cohnii]MDH5158899.1 PRD domain-containing protein [Staphylococcus cohnii]MDH5170443.1 PRD domain-containing protein [Staphylococcus cohnii]
MKITKILNNSVVLSKINGNERIVMGNGLAFGKKNGQQLERDKIEKVFRLTSQDQERMLTLLDEINQDVLLVSEQIIKEANKLYDSPISESIYIALTDHINYAIERTHEGFDIKNPLLYEIRTLYPKEYDVARDGLHKINQYFNVTLPKDEIGFIAMHIVNASLDENIANIYEITKITKSIVDIVRYHFNLSINEDELNYSRFMTHIKFFSQRLINQQSLSEVTDENLLDVLRQKYAKSDVCVDKIADFLFKHYNHKISNDERVYLILHIARLLK